MEIIDFSMKIIDFLMENYFSMKRLRTKVRGSVTNAIAFVTELWTVVRVLKFVRGDSDISGVVGQVCARSQTGIRIGFHIRPSIS